MLRLLLGAFVSLVLFVPIVAWSGETFVDGHFRKDGTYVQPHWRTTPDSSYNNNWSTSPNINPHTFQQGTRQPKIYDVNPSYEQPSGFGSRGYGGFSPSRRR
jgi:hypothetical protein